MYFGADAGKGGAKGARKFFWPAKGGKKLFLRHVSVLRMLAFCGEFTCG